MDYIEKYNEWCNNANIDEKTKKELESIKGNEEEIQDRFYKELEFGTAGLRGIIGAGTNRMNKYTVTKATQGLANYIIKNGAQDRGVAIAYDSRHMSVEFSEEAALCLNANGIKTYIFESLRPTPELSFAIRELKCIAGIVVTASHNPPKYNGYKVYWEDGAQITFPKDKEIINEVNSILDCTTAKTMSKEEAIEKGLYNVIGKEIDDKYIAELKKLVVNQDIINEVQKDLKIVYTPLHGTGNIPARRILKEIGFENVYVVPEQELPDGDFPTVSYPNPEDPKAFTLALKLAKEVDADIVIANDPDADRLGCYVKDTKTGEYIAFNGNMTGAILAEYVISEKKKNGVLPSNAAMVKSIVSSNMVDVIAKEYNVKLFEVLTGFKYIGEKIKEFEHSKDFEYVFGYEESYGYLVGTHARDKDGIVATMALCEAAAVYKKEGLTLWDKMLELYEKYGYFKEGIITVTLEGADGAEQIKAIMEKMRNSKVTSFGNYKIEAIRDYSTGKVQNLVTGEEYETGLPKSNVLYYELENNEWCCIRPSGTEPKIKLYMGVRGTSMANAEEKLEELKTEMGKIVK